MSWHGRGPGKRGYHHGNLREALIRGALDLIAQKGPAGLTIAEAARSAGVSPAAPYRHFRDREDLLADVARLGFERFTEALETAWNGGKPDPLRAYDALGKAYLAFARQEPALYAAMFEGGVPADSSPDLLQAADRAFGVLRTASEAVCATLPAEKRPPALMMALHIWALAHGIASLFARGDQARRKSPISPEELLESAFLIYLQGLGASG
jgi:AcrR family transcriptional regulator